MKSTKLTAALLTTALTLSMTTPAFATENQSDTDAVYGEQVSIANVFQTSLTDEELQAARAAALASDPTLTEEDLEQLRLEWEYSKESESWIPEGYHLKEEDGKTRLYNGSEIQRDCWYEEQSLWVHTDSEGFCYENRWFYENGKWYYFDGIYMSQAGWKQIDGKWYYFFAEPKSIAYSRSDGKVQGEMLASQWLGFEYTCWYGTWFYVDADGRMVTGWQNINGKWYYFDTNGSIRLGWLKDKDKWYYLSTDINDCSMTTGWEKIDGKWYYFDENGAMLSNCSKKINGVRYQFGASGAWIK